MSAPGIIFYNLSRQMSVSSFVPLCVDLRPLCGKKHLTTKYTKFRMKEHQVKSFSQMTKILLIL